jgi:two-component system sensor histidine kinase KdpD
MSTQIRSSAHHFLNLIRESKKGKLKIYIGMAAGVGKTYRMLLEAKELLENNIDVVAGYIETHGRKETIKQLNGIPILERKKVFYKGKLLEEFDLESVLLQKPEIVLVDELAHNNVNGSANQKRWQDVIQLIEAGISVISTVNIQHIESLNEQVEKITGIKISERVPDTIIHLADEVVNIDLTIEDLIDRLKEGKIYDPAKVTLALQNFFQNDKLLLLRDLALKEVSHQVERKILSQIPLVKRQKMGAIVTAISSNYHSAKRVIRKSSRIVSLYNSKWYTVYVQTPREAPLSINPLDQRQLINNFKLATELGSEVVEIKGTEVAKELVDFAVSVEASLIVIGKPSFSILYRLRIKNFFRELTNLTNKQNIDLFLISSNDDNKK